MSEEEAAVYRAQYNAAMRAAAEENAALAEAGEEVALLETTEEAEMIAMEAEAASGPFGWVLELATGIALAATAAALAYALYKQAQLMNAAQGIPTPPNHTPVDRPVVVHPPGVPIQPHDALKPGAVPTRAAVGAYLFLSKKKKH
jgi:hypothetical protein